MPVLAAARASSPASALWAVWERMLTASSRACWRERRAWAKYSSPETAAALPSAPASPGETLSTRMDSPRTLPSFLSAASAWSPSWV